MIALALLLLAAEPAPVQPAESAGALVVTKPKILVLDFRDDGVGANAVRVIRDTLVAHVSRDDRLEVVSADDVRRAVERDAANREANCDDESCLDEIADALGADLTLYGNAGKLGDLVVVNVNLYDARTGRSVGRETVEVSSLEALPGPLRAAGDRLIAQLKLAEEEGAIGPAFLIGATIASVGAAVAIVGVSIWLPNIQAVIDEDTFEKKTSAKQAQDTGFSMLIGGGVAAVLGIGVLGAALVFE